MTRTTQFRGGSGVSSTSYSGNNSENAPSPSSYGSASSYQIAVNGTPNSQFSRVNNDWSQSNAIVGIQGQKAGKGKGKGRGKRGGLWGEVISQAVVPFGLLAAQQSYSRKRSAGKKSRKSRGRKSRRRGTRRR